MKRVVSASLVALGISLLVGGSVSAQQGTGELRGKILDAQNAVLPGVAIVAKNEASGQFREIISGADGSFFMSALTPGLYEINAELVGFKKYQRKGVRVEVGKTMAIEVQLEVGGIEQQVTVTAESPIVDTTSKQLGGSVPTQELQDVPSLNRNFTSYLSLLPGITSTISVDSFGADSIRVNGQATQNANYMLDGAGNNDNFNNGNGGAQARTPVEAVQEFQLLTSNFDAEFGSTSGGVVNAVSKQGTNNYHGTGFYFTQNEKMTSLDYFAKQQGLSKPKADQQQWGGNLGGPIIKNKLHFFVNLERIDQNRARTMNINARPDLSATANTHDNVWNWMVRADHQINANNTWAIRWLRETSPQTNQLVQTNYTLKRAEEEQDADWTVVGTLNSVLANTRVNVFKVSYTHEDVFFGNPGYFETGDQTALDPLLVHQTFEDGIATRANRRMDPAYQVDDTFSWFVPNKKGDHDFKFGASYYYLPLHVFDAGNQNATFTFSASDLDFDRNNPRTYPDRMSVRVPGVSDYFVKGTEVGLFAQDKWKVSPRFTASLGLRYDLEVVKMDNTGNFLFQSGQESPIDRNNLSPRVGGTYMLDEKGSAIIRGGYGLYFQKTSYSNFTPIVSQGYTSNSFTVLFPANNLDPGPRSGALPTNPFLVNGPTVNRALLNQMFPSGTTQKNTGTVRFDTPDRHLPFAHQASIGVEKQLAGNIAVSADYVRASHRDLYMLQELNPGVRASTSATGAVTRIYPTSEFTASVQGLVNAGWFDYNGLQTSVQKRFSNHYQVRLSYTFSKGYGTARAPGATDSIITYTVDPTTKISDQHLDTFEGLGDQDRPHILSISGAVEIPHTKGLNLSGIWQYNSGGPFSITDQANDLNRNGQLLDEVVPAGTYSGNSTNPNAITVENTGGFNGARGPDFSLLSMRAAYRFRLPGSGNKRIMTYFDIFNVTNRANFNNPTGNRMDAATFLIVRSIRNGGPTRTAQFNVRYDF